MAIQTDATVPTACHNGPDKVIVAPRARYVKRKLAPRRVSRWGQHSGGPPYTSMGVGSGNDAIALIVLSRQQDGRWLVTEIGAYDEAAPWHTLYGDRIQRDRFAN